MPQALPARKRKDRKDRIIMRFDENAQLRSITAKTTPKRFKGQMREIKRMFAD